MVDAVSATRWEHDIVSTLTAHEGAWAHVFHEYEAVSNSTSSTSSTGAHFELEARIGSFNSLSHFSPTTPVDWFRATGLLSTMPKTSYTEEQWLSPSPSCPTKWRRRGPRAGWVLKSRVAHLDFMQWGVRIGASTEVPTDVPPPANWQHLDVAPVHEYETTSPDGLLRITYSTDDAGVVGRLELEHTIELGLDRTNFQKRIDAFLRGVGEWLGAYPDLITCWLAMVQVHRTIPTPLYFPLRWGSTPAMLMPRHIPDLLRRPDDFAVSLKADGERCYLLIADEHVVRVTRRGEMSLLSVPQIPHAARRSILDGEWYNFTFYVFDILAFRGQFLRNESQLARWDLWTHFEGLSTPSHPSCVYFKPYMINGQNGKSIGEWANALWTDRRTSNYVTSGSSLASATSAATAKGAGISADGVRTKQPYTLPPFLTDGIIFTDLRSSPTVTYKWRPYHTLDVRIVPNPTSTSTSSSSSSSSSSYTYGAQVLDKDRWMTVPGMTVSSHVALEPNSIVEVVAQDTRGALWTVLRTRPDKLYSNQWSPTTIDTLEYIRRPVELGMLSTSHYAISVSRPAPARKPAQEPVPPVITVRLLFSRDTPHGPIQRTSSSSSTSSSSALMSPDMQWRDQCNLVKRDLLTECNAAVVFDIGAGKANDLGKWLSTPSIQLVVAFEPSSDQIHQPDDGFLARVCARGGVIKAVEQLERAGTVHLLEIDTATYRPETSSSSTLLRILLCHNTCAGARSLFDESAIANEWLSSVQGRRCIVNFFSMHYWCESQSDLESTLQVWKQFRSGDGQPVDVIACLMDVTQFPESPPSTDLQIQCVKGSLPPPTPPTSTASTSTWTRRDYIRCWSSKKPIVLAVQWSHWKQSIQEAGVSVPDLIHSMQYLGCSLTKKESFAEFFERHNMPIPTGYRPWANTFVVTTWTL